MGLIVGWRRDSFVGAVLLAGAGRRGSGSPGLGVNPASGPPIWLLWDMVYLCPLVKGTWLLSPRSLQHVSLDSALAFAGVPWGNNDDVPGSGGPLRHPPERGTMCTDPTPLAGDGWHRLWPSLDNGALRATAKDEAGIFIATEGELRGRGQLSHRTYSTMPLL